MDLIKDKGKKGLINKTWERCRSVGGGGGTLVMKSKSWPRFGGTSEEAKCGRKGQITPEGCFSVYVGPEKQKFVIKIEYVNHPLFKVLLEEAALEYGYNSEGPLALPCKVDHFVKVLIEMGCTDDEIHHGWSFARKYSSYHLMSPTRLISMNKF